MIAYKCLVLDHDDTAVSSTEEIGFPSFSRTLERFRPDVRLTLDEFVSYCAEPGFHALCKDILHFTDEEMQEEARAWYAYVLEHMPAFYPGIAPLIRRYKAAGGVLCVVSHSHRDTILRDYRAQCGFEPDCIFGWELLPEQRKPNAWPLQQIMSRYALSADELIVVDDLKPGKDMADSCGVAFACAGWSHGGRPISDFMKQYAGVYLDTVQALETVLFT